MVPLDTIRSLAGEYGVIERERQLDIVQLVLALVLTGGTHDGIVRARRVRDRTELLLGGSANRPSFRRAIRAALELGPEAILIVTKLDRVGRNSIDVQETGLRAPKKTTSSKRIAGVRAELLAGEHQTA